MTLTDGGIAYSQLSYNTITTVIISLLYYYTVQYTLDMLKVIVVCSPPSLLSNQDVAIHSTLLNTL